MVPPRHTAPKAPARAPAAAVLHPAERQDQKQRQWAFLFFAPEKHLSSRWPGVTFPDKWLPSELTTDDFTREVLLIKWPF